MTNPNADPTIDTLQKHRTRALLLVVIGLILIPVNGYITDEPNPVLLALVPIGIIWYFVTRARLNSRKSSAVAAPGH